MSDKFILHSEYQPTGDQPQAIEKLTEGVLSGLKGQTLLGVTGSGKTFTMANIIKNVNRPTLVLSHNKTLAAQLCTEFRQFFPENAVEYFVSYYDFYMPEAYIPGKDVYIEKDAMINDEIDKLRHSATSAIFERRDVIIVASVSCIFSLGDPEEYKNLVVSLRPGLQISRDALIRRLVDINYERNDIGFERDKFRVRGDTVEIMPSNESENALRIEFFGDEIDRVSEIDKLTGKTKRLLNYASVYPATHYATSADKRERAFQEIENEMWERVKFFQNENRFIEAQRIKDRTLYDLEMLREVGSCSGVENYSRVMSGRPPLSTPYTLLDYLPDDFLLFIDESHVTVPQVRGMNGGDRARKKNLIDFGFRLPSAYDNRPLNFDEFESKIGQTIFVSATPAEYEAQNSQNTVEQIIRPTGLLDPKIEVRPAENQIDDLIFEIRKRTEKNEKVLVTCLTKKMAEDLSEYLEMNLIKVRYIHHTVKTMERMKLIRDLRKGVFDVLVGINLLREGLDIPEVSLVAILDADKEGFLRSERSLMQTIGRVARNADGMAIMYASTVTPSMQKCIDETERRRKIQSEYNEKHGIVPKTIIKSIGDIIEIEQKDSEENTEKLISKVKHSAKQRSEMIDELTRQMKDAAKALEFEKAAYFRDMINKLKE